MNSWWGYTDICHTHADVTWRWSIVTDLTVKRWWTLWERAWLLSLHCLFVDLVSHIKCAILFLRPVADSGNIRNSLIASDEAIVSRIPWVWWFVLLLLPFIFRTINVCIWSEFSLTIYFVSHIRSPIFLQGTIAHLWLIKLWIRLVLWLRNWLRYWWLVVVFSLSHPSCPI